jgi:hypothetical protein
VTRARAEKVERRIARVSRHCARVVLELRADGEHAGAARLEAAAIEVVEQMRRGSL